jgi:hypothetical protein
MDNGDDDPGWRRAGLDPLALLLPGRAVRRAVGDEGNPLLLLRRIFATFALMVAAVGVVAVVVTTWGDVGADATADPALAAVAIAVVGTACLFGPRVVNPRLDCENLVETYRRRFFLRLAFAELPALLAFVGVIFTGEAWLYLVGLVPTVVGFARAAPTAARLAADQEALAGEGCGRSLLHALTRSG